MRGLDRSLRLARLVGYAALASGLTAVTVAGAPAAGARVQGNLPGLDRHTVASWGANGIGQLGDGTTTARAQWGSVSGLGSGIVQVAAGGTFALALTSDGTVWGWGSNGAGQLGDGTTTYRTTPVQVTGLSGIIAVSAGVDQSLALRSDGTVWTWGGNRYGQLGIGVTGPAQLTAVQVPGLNAVTKISAGGLFSLALRADGTVWSWGYNASGELGNGTSADSDIPVQATGLSRVIGIAAGADSSLAIRTNPKTGGSAVWAWGSNYAGQVGDGTHTDRLTPEPVIGIGTTSFVGLAVGDGFALALRSDGSVWGWGADGYGQLANGPQSAGTATPTMSIGAGSGIIALAAGVNHALALRSDGTVLAWGSNSSGELGDGSTAAVSGPVQVAGFTNASQVTAGWEFSVAIHVPPLLRRP